PRRRPGRRHRRGPRVPRAGPRRRGRDRGGRGPRRRPRRPGDGPPRRLTLRTIGCPVQTGVTWAVAIVCVTHYSVSHGRRAALGTPAGTASGNRGARVSADPPAAELRLRAARTARQERLRR